MSEQIRIDRGLVAIAAVMRDDEPDAKTALSDMTPEQLHELMRVLLLTTGLARDAILAKFGVVIDALGVVEVLVFPVPEGESIAIDDGLH